jgi:aspartyl protease family protein
MRYAKWLLILVCAVSQAAQLRLVGILGEKALVELDGQRARMIAIGQTIGNARLMLIGHDMARFDVGGRIITLSLDNQSFSAPPASNEARLILSQAEDGQFLAHLRINKLPLLGIVDTGASSLALSSIHARMAGIKPEDGVAGRAHTAQGVVEIRRVKVHLLQLGGLILHDVDAVVLEGEYPLKPLIGMNVLQRFSMQREADVLILTQRY